MLLTRAAGRWSERLTPPALIIAVVAAAYLAFSINLPSLAAIKPSGVAIAPANGLVAPRL